MAIQSCNHGDYIVVYVGRKFRCPVCAAKQDFGLTNERIRVLKQKLEDANERIEKLENQEG